MPVRSTHKTRRGYIVLCSLTIFSCRASCAERGERGQPSAADGAPWMYDLPFSGFRRFVSSTAIAFTKSKYTTMESGRPRSATALLALIGALSPQPMNAFAARMGSPALLPAYAKNAPSSLLRKPRYAAHAAACSIPVTRARGCVHTLHRLWLSLGVRYSPAVNFAHFLLRLPALPAMAADAMAPPRFCMFGHGAQACPCFYPLLAFIT